MSSPLAIGATTAVLRELLLSGLQAANVAGALGASGAEVTVLPPDLVPRAPPAEVPQLNLFLYNTVRNAAWAGDALPSRDARGDRVANPLLALDLHYLLSAYGNREYEAEVLLGAAVQTLHDTPGLGRDFIREALDPGGGGNPTLTAFSGAGLADQFEALRIAPAPLPSEEIARLWSAFQTPYRPSAAYVVSVVLIASSRPARTALPVRARVFRALPIPGLRIDRVRAVDGPLEPVVPVGRLRLEGRQLGDPDLQVWINSLDFTVAVATREAGAIELAWPAALPPDLRSGAAGALVVKPVALGLPPTPHEGFTSNVAGFVLCPVVGAMTQPQPGRLRVPCRPRVGRGQRVQLMLNEVVAAPGAVPRAFTLAAPAANGVPLVDDSADHIDFDVSRVPAGTWLVRLQVDGASSVLEVDAAGRYTGPQVVL